MGYATEESLVLYEGVFKDSMDSEKTKSIAEIDTSKRANEIILINNFSKVNKKFETSYIDSENYQINTNKNIDTEFADFNSKLSVINSNYTTTISKTRTDNKAEFDKLYQSKRTEMQGVMDSSVNNAPDITDVYGVRRGSDLIYERDIALADMVSIEPHKDDFYANYMSGGVSFVNGYGNRIEPFNLSDINCTGMDTAQTLDKSIYFKNGERGIDMSRRVHPIIDKETYTSTLTYPNARDVKYIRIEVDRPKEYNNDVLLYSGSEYNIYLKHPVRDLFPNIHRNIVFIDTLKNELFINGIKINQSSYYSKIIPLIEPIAMYSSERANTSKRFVKEDLLDILGKEPVGYSTVVMDPDTGIFKNPEGTCQGQLVIEKERCLVCQGNVLDDDSINGVVKLYDPSMCNFNISEMNLHKNIYGYNEITVNGEDGYSGGSIRLSNYAEYLPWKTSGTIDFMSNDYIRVSPRLPHSLTSGNLLNNTNIIWNNLYYPTRNEFQVCITTTKVPSVYKDVSIMWKNLKYTEYAICDGIFTTSHTDIYEEKIYKKLFYGHNICETRKNVSDFNSIDASDLIFENIDSQIQMVSFKCGADTLALYRSIVTPNIEEYRGKKFSHLVPYFKNISKFTLRLDANVLCESGFSSYILKPGEELSMIRFVMKEACQYGYFQFRVNVLDTISGDTCKFLISKHTCVYEGVDLIPYFKSERPETIIDFVE